MASSVQAAQRRSFFARQNALRSAGSLAARESAMKMEFAQWEQAHPEASWDERDRKKRSLANKHRV